MGHNREKFGALLKSIIGNLKSIIGSGLMSSLNQWCNQPHHFRSNTITYSVTSHMSQYYLNVCTWIKACSANGRKRVACDDVIKCFLFNKAAILTNLVNLLRYLSIGMLNM